MPETLAERIKKAREEARREAERQKEFAYQSSAANLGRNVTAATWFLAQIAMGAQWIWSRVVSPGMRVIRRPIWWLAKQYIRVWDRVVIVKDPFGKPTFSKTRAGLMILATAFAWWYLVGPFFDLAIDAAVYAATVQSDESVILLSSQEINTAENTHAVEGCLQIPCSDRNAVYFRVKYSLFNNLWSLTHFRGVFRPDFIAAAVASGYQRCVITSYGLRWSLIVRNLNIFPELLEIKQCNLLQPAAK
jgi:hypothetical protein